MTVTAILPGIGNSDSDHWQSHWERTNPSFMRVQQRDWDSPVCKEWMDPLGFSPLPLLAFPFPTIVVASTNDPYGSIEFAKSVASAWGSRFICIGAAGHINSKSGLGEWPDGFAYLKQLLEPLT